jgi:hypothetical protein
MMGRRLGASAFSCERTTDRLLSEWLGAASAADGALALIAFRDDFGDLEGWDDGIRGTLGTLTSLS